MNQMFVLGDNRFEKGWAYAETENDARFTGVDVCPLCGNAISMMKCQNPLEVIVSSKKLGDFIFGTLPYPIVSKRFKELFESNNLKGIKEFRKLERIRFKSEILYKDYYYIQPERINIGVTVENGEYEIEDDYHICKMCRPNKKVYFNMKGFIMNHIADEIGYDIFLTYMQGDTVFCNNRFTQFCKENDIKNWESHTTLISKFSIG